MESTSIEVEFRKSSFPLSDLQVYQFGLYLKQLKAWNSYINLTSIDDELGIIHKHFLDSLKLLKFIELPLACRLIDIGSGAGFPGLPLKIYQPSINLLLVESVSKKASFLQFVLQCRHDFATSKMSFGLIICYVCSMSAILQKHRKIEMLSHFWRAFPTDFSSHFAEAQTL